MLLTAIILLLTFIIVILLFRPRSSITGGSRSKHFYENIWDDDCLDDYQELDTVLCKYEKKIIGNKLRKFIKWYKQSFNAKDIYDYLINNNFQMYAVKLFISGNNVSITGKKTNDYKNIAPHFIFIAKDHSCVRLKPVVGGFTTSHTPFPTVSFSIVYNTNQTNFANEAFKVTRKGEPIPKGGLKFDDACMNPTLSMNRMNQLMKDTHIRLPKPSIKDCRFFINIELDD